MRDGQWHRDAVPTRERTLCQLKMQVTDVGKPLMSVARSCDANHRATFWSRGRGGIVDDKVGSIAKFDRADDAYRLEVNVPESNVYELGEASVEGFSGRGM